MGTPLRKPRIVANDRLRSLAHAPAPMPAALPIAFAPSHHAPKIRHVRLAPAPARRDFSWAAAAAVLLLGMVIFLFGAVAGTVFWFTYDSINPGNITASSSVAARLAQPPEPAAPLPAPAMDIVLPAGDSASTAANETSPVLPAGNMGEVQTVLRENGSVAIDDILDSARTRLEQGENIAALVLYERVLAEKPGNRDALEGKAYALGHFAMMPGAPLAAFTELQRMEMLVPDNAGLQAALGKILAQRGKDAEAIDHLDRAVRLSPGDVADRLDLAILYDRVGKIPEALALYRQILRLARDSDSEVLPPEMLESIRRRAAYLVMQIAGP